MGNLLLREAPKGGNDNTKLQEKRGEAADFLLLVTENQHVCQCLCHS